MVGVTIPILVEGGKYDASRRGGNTVRRGSGSNAKQLVKKSSRSKLKTFQVQINLDTQDSDNASDPSNFKTKPQFLKRRSVQKIACDPCDKNVTVSSECVKHVKLGHEGSTVPRVLTRRQSSGKDLLGLAKTPTGISRALTRRQSGGRHDVLGLDQRRGSCGKRETRAALRLGSISGLEIDKENTSTLTRLSAISLCSGVEQGFSQFEREALNGHNKYRVRHGVCLLQLDRKLCTHAQSYAQTLADTDTFQHSNDPLYGENLYWSWSSDPGWVLAAGEAVESWYEEKKGYNYASEPEDIDSGHFTQMIWAKSKHLGVGLARSSTTGKYITVMKYDPAGNYLGKYRENVFRPAICGGKKIIEL